MIGRRCFHALAAALLVGTAHADGTSLLDINTTEQEQADLREWLSASSRPIEASRVPAAAIRAALAAVPKLKIAQTAVLRHRPMTSFRTVTEYQFKGRDAAGHPVSIRTAPQGTATIVTRIVPIAEVSDAELTDGRKYAAKHGYTLTSALVVTRDVRAIVGVKTHTEYYLRGISPRQPNTERFVWLSGKARFWLSDLDDLFVKQMGLEGT